MRTKPPPRQKLKYMVCAGCFRLLGTKHTPPMLRVEEKGEKLYVHVGCEINWTKVYQLREANREAGQPGGVPVLRDIQRGLRGLRV